MDELDAFVDELRRARGGDPKCIPRFSRRDGGTEAKCLFLAMTPNKKAVASGYISRENPDPSARNFTKVHDDADFRREDTISWNIVPWYSEDAAKEVQAGLRWLGKLLDLLPKLRVVVLLGETARKATPSLYQYERLPDLCVIHALHPGNQAMSQPGKRDQLEAAFRKAARRVYPQPS